MDNTLSAWQSLFLSRIRSGWNTARFASPRQRWLWLGLSAGWGVLLAGLVYAMMAAQATLLNEHAIEAIFLYIGLLMLVSAAPQAFAAIFQSGDLAWLMTAPLSTTTVVSVKLFDAVMAGARVFLPILIGAWFGISAVLHLPPIGWLMSLLIWGLFTLLTASLCCLLLLLAARLLGVNRVQSSLILFQIGVPIALLLALMFGVGNPQQILDITQFPLPSFARALPSNWAVGALFGIQEGMWGKALFAMGLMLVGSLYCLCACAWLGTALFSKTELIELANEARVPTPKQESGLLVAHTPSAWRALIKRDWLLIRRDPIIFWQIMTPLLLAPLPAIMAQRFPVTEDQDTIRWLTYSLIVSMLYLQTSVVSLSSVGLDARAYWMVKSAPVSPLRYLMAKWALSMLICGGPASLLILFYSVLLRIEFPYALLFWLLMMVSCASLSGIGVGLAALFPRFVWDNPAQRVSVWALLWGFGLYLAYVGSVSALAGIAYWLGLQTSVPYMAWWTGGLWILLLSAIALFVPMVLGAWRLEDYDWEH